MRLSRLLGPLVCGTALLAGAEAQASSLVYQRSTRPSGEAP